MTGPEVDPLCGDGSNLRAAYEVFIKASPQLAEHLRHPDGITREGVVKWSMSDDGVMHVEMIHDCWLMQCQHNGWPEDGAAKPRPEPPSGLQRYDGTMSDA